MLLDSRPYTFDRVVRMIIGVLLTIGLVLMLQYLSDVLLPFAVALVLAYLLNPLVNRLEKLVKNRVLAVVLALLVVGIAFIGILSVVAPLIAMEISRSSGLVKQMLSNSKLASSLATYLPEDVWQTIREWLREPDIQALLAPDELSTMARAGLKRILPGMWGVISGTAQAALWVVGLSVVLLYVVFILVDFRNISRAWNEYLPHNIRDSANTFLQDVILYMNRYFRAQVLIAAIVGVLFATGFAIVGLPLGIVVGLTMGVLNIVPYLQMIALPPIVLLAIVQAAETGQSVFVVLGLVLMVVAIVQALQDGVLVPRIMGGVTGLSPAMILLALAVWGKILGMLGLLLAIPATCLLLAYYKRFLVSLREDDAEALEE